MRVCACAYACMCVCFIKKTEVVWKKVAAHQILNVTEVASRAEVLPPWDKWPWLDAFLGTTAEGLATRAQGAEMLLHSLPGTGQPLDAEWRGLEYAPLSLWTEPHLRLAAPGTDSQVLGRTSACFSISL